MSPKTYNQYFRLWCVQFARGNQSLKTFTGTFFLYATHMLLYKVRQQVVCVLRPQCTLVFVSVSHHLLMVAIA